MVCIYLQHISVPALGSPARPEVGKPPKGEGVKSQTFIFRRGFVLVAVFSSVGKTTVCVFACLWVCLYTDLECVPSGTDTDRYMPQAS